MKTLLMLLRREYWEYKRGLFFGQLIAVSICFFMLLAKEYLAAELVLTLCMGVVYLALVAASILQIAGTGLYTERKDRSILFWKSLPITDWQVVFSKALFCAAVLPVVGFFLALVYSFLFCMIVQASPFTASFFKLAWSYFLLLPWLSVQIATCVAWLLLVSVSVRTNPLLLSIGVPAIGYSLLSAAFAHSRPAILEWFHIEVFSRMYFNFFDPFHLTTLSGDLDSSSLLGQTYGSFLTAYPYISILVTAAALYAATRLRRWNKG